MLRFLQIDFLSNYAIHLEWDFLSEPEESKTWVLQRSESPEGPFEDVSPPLKQTDWLDKITNKFSNYRTLYYRVSLDGVVSRNYPVRPDERTYIRNHIIWREELFLRRFAGSPMAVFKRRSVGERCPECYDPITKRSMRSKCETCFDTTFVDGYYDPIVTYGQINPSQDFSALSIYGKKEPHQSIIWVSSYPYINTDDLLFDYAGRGKFWKVYNVSRTEHLRSTVRQICTIEELRKDAVEYRMEIPPLNDCRDVNIFTEEF